MGVKCPAIFHCEWLGGGGGGGGGIPFSKFQIPTPITGSLVAAIIKVSDALDQIVTG